MSETGAGPLLERLESALESLLSMLEAEDADAPEVIRSAFAEVTRAFDAVRLRIEGRAPDVDERRRLEKSLKLYAVALNTLAGQREQMALAHKASGEALERLGALRRGKTSGVSCDVRG